MPAPLAPTPTAWTVPPMTRQTTPTTMKTKAAVREQRGAQKVEASGSQPRRPVSTGDPRPPVVAQFPGSREGGALSAGYRHVLAASLRPGDDVCVAEMV